MAAVYANRISEEPMAFLFRFGVGPPGWLYFFLDRVGAGGVANLHQPGRGHRFGAFFNGALACFLFFSLEGWDLPAKIYLDVLLVIPYVVIAVLFLLRCKWQVDLKGA
jgi:hypothetical protein